jgi:hypothetical protein
VDVHLEQSRTASYASWNNFRNLCPPNSVKKAVVFKRVISEAGNLQEWIVKYYRE